MHPGTPGRGGLVFCTYLGAQGTYVATTLALGADGSIFAAGYGFIGLPSSANGNGFAGGIADGFLVVMK